MCLDYPTTEASCQEVDWLVRANCHWVGRIERDWKCPFGVASDGPDELAEDTRTTEICSFGEPALKNLLRSAWNLLGKRQQREATTDHCTVIVCRSQRCFAVEIVGSSCTVSKMATTSRVASTWNANWLVPRQGGCSWNGTRKLSNHSSSYNQVQCKVASR